jgi:hypothetical protein
MSLGEKLEDVNSYSVFLKYVPNLLVDGCAVFDGIWSRSLFITFSIFA